MDLRDAAGRDGPFGFGRDHAIEVEDDVTAYFEHGDGMHGTFVASTGEAPGTNRLEIAAENGRRVYEGDRLTWPRNDTPTGEYSRTATDFSRARRIARGSFPSRATGAGTSRFSRISSTRSPPAHQKK